MADGLDSMAAMRNKAAASRRTLPPPRHQPRRTPVPMPDQPAAVESTPAAPDTGGQVAPSAVPTPPAGVVISEELTKVSIYLDESTDTYLETVRAAARAGKPRVDATRSAVVRLALTRLADQLAPAQVVAELRRNATSHTGPGRKRA